MLENQADDDGQLDAPIQPDWQHLLGSCRTAAQQAVHSSSLLLAFSSPAGSPGVLCVLVGLVCLMQLLLGVSQRLLMADDVSRGRLQLLLQSQRVRTLCAVG